MFKALGRQLRRPSGFLGEIVAKMMDRRNKEFYEKIIFELDVKKDDKLFEIGYGPGLGIKLITSKNIDCTINGLDYSELMLRKATQRNQKFVDSGVVRLKYGDFLVMDFDNERYDKIYCVNVIYFWSDLSKAFSKIYAMLNSGGRYCIFMSHEKEFEKAKFAEDFCKYSIDEVESELKRIGFTSVEYVFDNGYFIKAFK